MSNEEWFYLQDLNLKFKNFVLPYVRDGKISANTARELLNAVADVAQDEKKLFRYSEADRA